MRNSCFFCSAALFASRSLCSFQRVSSSSSSSALATVALCSLLCASPGRNGLPSGRLWKRMVRTLPRAGERCPGSASCPLSKGEPVQRSTTRSRSSRRCCSRHPQLGRIHSALPAGAGPRRSPLRDTSREAVDSAEPSVLMANTL